MFRIVIIAFCIALSAPVASAGVLERIAETKTFRLGYRDDAPPFAYEPTPGNRIGYSIDLCRAVADGVKSALGLPALVVQYVAVQAENRFDMVANGTVDILCGPTTATLSRRDKVDFSLPTFVDGAGVMIRDADGITELGDLAGRRLGVRAGTTTAQALRASFPDADIQEVGDHADGIVGLNARALDAYFADRTLLIYLRASIAEAADLHIADEYLTIEPYALALPKGDTRFRLLVDRTLSQLYQSEQIEAIAAKAFGKAELSDLVRTLYRITPLPE